MTDHPDQTQPHSSIAILSQDEIIVKSCVENLKKASIGEQNAPKPIGWIFTEDNAPIDRNEPANASVTNENVKKVLPFELFQSVLDVGNYPMACDECPDCLEEICDFHRSGLEHEYGSTPIKQQKIPKRRKWKEYNKKISKCQGMSLCIAIFLIILVVAYFNLFVSMFIVFVLVLTILTH